MRPYRSNGLVVPVLGEHSSTLGSFPSVDLLLIE